MTTKTLRLVRFTCGMMGVWAGTSLILGLLIRAQSARFQVVGAVDAAPADSWTVLLARSLVLGVAAGLVASFLERGVFPRYDRRVGVGVRLLFRTVAYAALASLLVLLAVFLSGTLGRGLAFADVLVSPGFRAFVMSALFVQTILTVVVASFLINAVLQVGRLLGPQAATQIFLGRYLRPVHEDRSFLFIDLADSTGLAERLGPLEFAEFKNDFFHDVAGPVLDTHGQIVQYVGDEVMITWPRRKKSRSTASESVRCFFEVCRHVDASAAGYVARYGEVPRFRAGLHSGPVVVSQLGDLKTEIVFSGDAVNATARIQGLCKELQRDFLVSSDAIGEVDLPDGVVPEDMGVHSLRGRTAPVTILALSREPAEVSTVNVPSNRAV